MSGALGPAPGPGPGSRRPYPGCLVRCISTNGVACRRSTNLEDRRTTCGVAFGQAAVVDEVQGEWVRVEGGWLPMQIGGVPKFEVVGRHCLHSKHLQVMSGSPTPTGSLHTLPEDGSFSSAPAVLLTGPHEPRCAQGELRLGGCLDAERNVIAQRTEALARLAPEAAEAKCCGAAMGGEESKADDEADAGEPLDLGLRAWLQAAAEASLRGAGGAAGKRPRPHSGAAAGRE